MRDSRYKSYADIHDLTYTPGQLTQRIASLSQDEGEILAEQHKCFSEVTFNSSLSREEAVSVTEEFMRSVQRLILVLYGGTSEQYRSVSSEVRRLAFRNKHDDRISALNDFALAQTSYQLALTELYPKGFTFGSFGKIPPGARYAAMCANLAHLFRTGEFRRATGAAEAFIELSGQLHKPVFEAEIRLSFAEGLFCAGRSREASTQLATASELLLPDGLLLPLAKRHTSLLGVGGEYITDKYPELSGVYDSVLSALRQNRSDILDGVFGLRFGFKLSERERMTALLASLGRTNPQIADSLSLSEYTVKKYLQSVFQKMNVSKRSELRTALPILRNA